MWASIPGSSLREAPEWRPRETGVGVIQSPSDRHGVSFPTLREREAIGNPGAASRMLVAALDSRSGLRPAGNDNPRLRAKRSRGNRITTLARFPTERNRSVDKKSRQIKKLERIHIEKVSSTFSECALAAEIRDRFEKCRARFMRKTGFHFFAARSKGSGPCRRPWSASLARAAIRPPRSASCASGSRQACRPRCRSRRHAAPSSTCRNRPRKCAGR